MAGRGQAFGAKGEARPAAPSSSPQSKKRNRSHPTPPILDPRPPSPALPWQPAIGRCKYRVLCPATGDAPPEREAWPGRSPSGHLGVYTGRPRARRSGPQTARGRGGARAGGAARGERHWKAAGRGASGARGPRRSRRQLGEPAGVRGCNSPAPAKQCVACSGTQLAGGGGGAPSPPETESLTSPRRPLGPSAQLLAPQLAGAGPSGGAGPPLRRCCLLPHLSRGGCGRPPAASSGPGPRRDGAAAGYAGQTGRRAAAPGARAGRRGGA